MSNIHPSLWTDLPSYASGPEWVKFINEILDALDDYPASVFFTDDKELRFDVEHAIADSIVPVYTQEQWEIFQRLELWSLLYELTDDSLLTRNAKEMASNLIYLVAVEITPPLWNNYRALKESQKVAS